jgi:hypothetical protein
MALYWQYRDKYRTHRPGALVTDIRTEEDITEKVSAVSEWKFNRNVPLRHEINEAEDYLNREVESSNINPRE